MLLPKKNILEAEGYDVPLFLDKYLMKLDMNENAFGPSPRVIEALKNITPDDIRLYPAYGELIRKIAQSNSIDTAMILPTNGADEAINYLFDTFVNHYDTVVTVKPSFSMPKVYAKGVGCIYNEIKYDKQWEFPLEKVMDAAADKPKMIILTTPNNPTGEAIEKSTIIKIIEAFPDSVVMIDETYASYCDGFNTELALKYENVAIVRSMSKDFGLAGLRLGYIISNAQNINYIKRIISPYSVNVMAAKAGVAALSDVASFELVKDKIEKSKIILREGLRPFVKQFFKTDANFLLADFGEKTEFIYKKLLNAGILVKRFPHSEGLETCLRITYPHPDQARILIYCLRPKDTIVFDMDGVLVDTSNSYRLAIKSTFEHFTAKPVDFAQIQAAKNLGGLNNDWDLTAYLIKQAGFEVPKNEIIDKFQEFYFGENGFINNEKFLLSIEFLKNISKTYDLAIFTGRPKEEALYALRKLDAENLFLSVISMEDVPEGFHKPDPWGLNKIREISGAQKIFYLGDTPDDIKSAKAAGVFALGVLPPQDKSADLKLRMEQEGADIVFERTEELATFLEKGEKLGVTNEKQLR